MTASRGQSRDEPCDEPGEHGADDVVAPPAAGAVASGLRSAETPDAAPDELPVASHDLPPSFPPPRRSASHASGRAAASPRGRRRGGRLSGLVGLIAVLVVTALIKTYVVNWFEIPSSSMEDTLAVGDHVAVWMTGADGLERGDVVVFRDPDGWLNVNEPTGLRGIVQDLLILIHQLPEDTGHILIKRVIGLPGDHVVADGSGTLSVNGVVLDEDYVKDGRSPSDVAFDVVVPEGYVWVMGDNRSNSADSRYHQDDAHGGFVPMEDVIGEGTAIIWPVTHWSDLSEGTRAFDLVPEPGSVPAPSRPAREEGA